MAGRVSGKVALITGGSRGIGKAASLLLAEEGASVCVNYSRSGEEARRLVTHISRMNGKAIAIHADVTKKGEVRTMVEKAIDSFGKIDILVNSAGIIRKGETLDMKDDDLDAMLSVNVKGTVYPTQEVAKNMISRRYGKIVNIGSIAGIGTAYPGTTPYAITKGAIITLTKRFAYEFGRYGINVNAIAPGYVETDMTRLGKTKEESKRDADDVARRTVLGRIGKPEEIASVILFLSSDESSFITGQILTVDGGRMDYMTHSL